MSVGGFTPCRQLGSYSRRKQVWTYSVLVENKFGLFQVLGDQIYEMRCPFVAVGLNARFIVLPHWDNMSQAHMLTHDLRIISPTHLITGNAYTPVTILSILTTNAPPVLHFNANIQSKFSFTQLHFLCLLTYFVFNLFRKLLKIYASILTILYL